MSRLGVKVALWLALALAAVVSLGLYGREQRARGRAEAVGAQLRAENDSLRLAQAQVDTIYQRDTVRLWRVKERWDTAVVTVDRWKRDTLEVVRYVALADSTVRACTAALRTCEQRDSLWALRYGNLERQFATVPRPRPGWLVWTERGLTLWAGIELGKRTR